MVCTSGSSGGPGAGVGLSPGYGVAAGEGPQLVGGTRYPHFFRQKTLPLLRTLREIAAASHEPARTSSIGELARELARKCRTLVVGGTSSTQGTPSLPSGLLYGPYIPTAIEPISAATIAPQLPSAIGARFAAFLLQLATARAALTDATRAASREARAKALVACSLFSHVRWASGARLAPELRDTEGGGCVVACRHNVGTR